MSLEFSPYEQAVCFQPLVSFIWHKGKCTPLFTQSDVGVFISSCRTVVLNQGQFYSLGDIGNIWRYFWLSQPEFLLVSSGWRLGMPLNTL